MGSPGSIKAANGRQCDDKVLLPTTPAMRYRERTLVLSGATGRALAGTVWRVLTDSGSTTRLATLSKY
eukprot:3485807-Rhodomonas_salina.2